MAAVLASRRAAAHAASHSWAASHTSAFYDGALMLGRSFAGPVSLGPQLLAARGWHSGSPMPEAEFTLSEYRDIPELGFNRGQEFCMLTLRHPVFESRAGVGRDALYKKKEREAAEGIDRLFTKFAGGSGGKLQDQKLKDALAGIGLRPDDFTELGILQRYAVCHPRQICRAEFDGVAREAWGRSRLVAFDDRLAEVHDGVVAHSPLAGTRALAFISRDSPINWVMRLMRHAWPYAINRVVIMRNVRPNPNLKPALMEELFPWVVRDYSVSGLTSASELAQAAASSASTAEGGFVVRIQAFDPNIPDIYLPLRGLPENAPRGIMANVASVLCSLRQTISVQSTLLQPQ